MKKTIYILLILFCISLFSVAWANQLSVDQILKKMEESGNYETSQGKAIMKIINKEDDVTEMGLVMYDQRAKGDQEEKQLMRFVSPARLKGTAILVNGDSIWYYNNRTNRVRLLSQSAKKGSMMGSSFSYEDMSVNYSKDFTGEIVKETGNEYLLKLYPKDKAKDFKYIISKVRKKDYLTIAADYYNQQGIKYKEMINKDFKEVSGRIVPLIVTMKDIEENKVTIFEIDDKSMQYDINLDANIFSERNLRK